MNDKNPLPVVAHIAYCGVGGLPSVCMALALEGLTQTRQVIAWYGVEALAEQYKDKCIEHDISFKHYYKKPGLDLGTQREISQWFAAEHVTAIICHSPASLFAARMLKRKYKQLKIISVEHHSNARKGKKEWILSALALKMAHHVVYLSKEYQQQVVDKLGVFASTKNTHIIANGIALGNFRRATDTGSNFIGMAARMFDGKDHATLLRAFARLPDIYQLELIGDGPLRPMLEQMCDELAIRQRVTFIGEILNQDVIRTMKRWDLFVLSTLGETMSIAIMEAQALGLAIVGTDVSGVSSSIRDRSDGLLVPVGNDQAMATAMSSLLNDPSLRKRLRNAAYERAQAEHSVAVCWAKYYRLIDEQL